MPTTWAMYVGRLSLKGTWKGILEVSAFLVYYIKTVIKVPNPESITPITITPKSTHRTRRDGARRAK